MFRMICINRNGFSEVYSKNSMENQIHFLGIKSTFGMIKNIFTSPKKTKREKTPTKKRNEPENTKIPEQKATIEKNETKNPNEYSFVFFSLFS